MRLSQATEVVMEIQPRSVPPGQAWKDGWPQTVREFERLVEFFQHRLVQYAFRRLGNRQDAEDVAQEVFVRAFKNPMPKKRVRHVSSYLYRMAANACTDFLRRRKHAWREVSIEETNERIVDVRTSPSEEAAAAEEIDRIEKLMDRLPHRQAEVVRLRVYDELTFAEIAEVVGSSVPTVKSRFRYGLERLRPFVAREWEVLP
jgi:RNA polymerase sigma-70 factor, ECF subfamily